MVTAAEYLESVKARTLASPIDQNSMACLTLLWKRALTHQGMAYVKPFTHKEIGQLRNVRNRLATAGLDPHQTLRTVLENWEAFRACVMSVKGLNRAPRVPMLGFVLEHCDILINMPA